MFGLVEGKTDFADIMFLVALVVFLVAAILQFQKKQIETALVSVGLAAVALAWLVL